MSSLLFSITHVLARDSISNDMMYKRLAIGISISAILISVFKLHLPNITSPIFLARLYSHLHIPCSMSSIPSNHPYHKELEIATLAVKRASILTKKLSDSIAATSKNGTQIKDDKSPVTVGDYAAQAIVNHALQLNFPSDKIVGEEDSISLRDGSDEANKLNSRILQILEDAQKETASLNNQLGDLKTIEEIHSSIDLGSYEGGPTGRFWALDPIDGTKGFLRGDQFAVCLALIEDGKVVLGVIGCPNLAEHIVSNEEQTGRIGGLFSAVHGLGSYYSPLFESNEFVPLSKQQKLQMTEETSPSKLKVMEGVEKGHSAHSTQSQIKRELGFDDSTVANQTINLDSQVKYCVLAKGQADIYLRLPINDTYREKIWDHASGNILIHESGGQVGDIRGSPLDFGKGRYLQSKGVIAANKKIFATVIDAVEKVLSKQ
ncbi:putative 3 (2),5-bisphosphate nucleotidase [Clavispora lusitaniae]|uniref:3 (2),5-bisphosphate nucleotidase n=1 Tax=Clavispora lusitaniae TaxID=36911 RepID=A0ACD0WNJ6_CLALS|nr:putative 3 (2),5-bisphosphate nucleotidase [Clavispora lusitaniae]QFZ34628.1 putative 3 (2),5-bisphosphate nucleotidase [Clavispora lusitaniae]QFZ40313.1 putative 3 (2),5-bisphosphate nucleotidase [Clavispora lusitaniae]QFZ45993.1 putative 3 (2),5-bisphosphate nucleotidase [Clavispora lusitaniae]QFZ51655.1 putative 3 (2),5-bisphosphate nucleotidase [Clavispora lusitaniae]